MCYFGHHCVLTTDSSQLSPSLEIVLCSRKLPCPRPHPSSEAAHLHRLAHAGNSGGIPSFPHFSKASFWQWNGKWIREGSRALRVRAFSWGEAETGRDTEMETSRKSTEPCKVNSLKPGSGQVLVSVQVFSPFSLLSQALQRCPHFLRTLLPGDSASV